MGAASSPIRICPECGTRNSGLSLFCAECGGSLTNATVESADESQTTATYRPYQPEDAASDPYATQQFKPQSTVAIRPSDPSDNDQMWAGSGSITAEYAPPATESRRGFVLGWIAGILILLAIGFLGWTSFLDPGTRDSIIGFFS